MNNPFTVTEAQIAGTILWNPTNEDMELQYAGFTLYLKAGDRQPVTPPCARHLLNSHGQRGLTSLTYGCDEKQVGEDAVRRNIEFKRKMMTDYNQNNMARSKGGLSYLNPGPDIKKYALELGLHLDEPYTMKDPEREAISKSTVENEALRLKLAAQETEMAELRTMMKQIMENQNASDGAAKPDRPKERAGWKKE